MIVKVTKEEVKITELTQVNQGDYRVNLCEFILPDCFSGLSVTAVFNGILVPVAQNRCYIPSLEKGNCILGVYAYKEVNGETQLMYSPKPAVFYVDKGSYTTDVNTETLPKSFDYEAYCNMLKDFWEQLVNENVPAFYGESIFKTIDLPLTQTNYAYIYQDGQCIKKSEAEEGFSPVTRCPKYLGFRIEDDETRLYLYIGTLNDEGDFVFDESYHIDTTGETNAVNYLRQAHNRFIETDGSKYFYYKLAKGNGATLMGCDAFPEGESEIFATVPNYIKSGKKDSDGNEISPETKITGEKYYSVVLPSGCFYAVLNKKGMPTFLKDDIEDDELTTKPIFNVSYQTGVKVVDGEKVPVIEVNRGASFGYIPENVGAALLRLPHTYNLNDLCIYTDKSVKSNAKTGRRGKAKEIGEKLIKDFSFESQKEIFWNDNPRLMKVGRRFYGVPYSSRWVNSHYVGFEVSAETALNALNDPYSVAYDGGFVAEGKRAEAVSGHTEISATGGTGYGLVCSAFTSLITGNPYPQSNRGYTFDSSFVLEDTVDMNCGEVLVNKGISHCVFVDEIYDNGYSLYEAVDPCVAKTTHTCPEDKATYAASKVRTSYLDNYSYSVVNKDTSGYERLAPLLNLENITIPNGNVRVWRGNKAVYGSWDVAPKEEGRAFGGSGIGVTLHNGVTGFTLRKPSGIVEVIDKSEYPECFKNESYADISSFVTENGTYEISDGNVSEFFRFYNHDTVHLTFDNEGKAVFKNSNGSIADDVEYAYVSVKGYGGSFGNDDSEGAMVIAKGNCYPDLALDTSRITDVRAAIVSDPADECWGKYSCATSPEVVSEYKGDIDVINTINKNVDSIKILKPTDFKNYTSDYWIATASSIPIKIGDKITVKPNGFMAWVRIQNSDDISTATNLKNLGNTTETFEYVSEYDGWVTVQISKTDGNKITPEDYACDIRITTLSQTNKNTQEIEKLKDDKQDTLVSGTNIKTINGESILGDGDIEITSGEEVIIESDEKNSPLFSKHTPFTNIIDDCQDVSKWIGDTVSIDTNNHILGSHSLHSNKEMRSTKNTYDLTKNYLVLKLKVNSISQGSRLLLSVGNTSAPSTRVVYEIARGTAWTTPEGWQEIVISTSNYSYGSVDATDFSNINDLHLMTQTLSGTGTPEVDWNLQYVGTRPKTTNEGIVTFTFDDGWDSQYTGVKLLAEKGITSTIFAIKEAIESRNYLTLDNLKALVDLYGTDVEVHGDPSYDQWDEEDLKTHWSASQKFIRDNKLGNGKHMAYPNGMFPENVVKIAKEYFDSCRTITPFLPVETLPVADRFRIRAVSSIGSNGVTPDKVKGYIDRVTKDGGWLILVLHKIGDTTGDSMYCSEADLSSIADYAIESGVDIMNYAEVMDRFYADLSPENDVVTSGGSTNEEWVEVLNTTLTEDVAYVDMVAPDGKMFKKLHILVATDRAGLSTGSKIQIKGTKSVAFGENNGENLTITSGTVNTWGYPTFIIEKGALFPLVYVAQGTTNGGNVTPVYMGGVGQNNVNGADVRYINNGPWKTIRIQPATANVVFKAGVTIYAWGVYE